MACKCAIRVDEYNGWKCSVTDGECVFTYPSSKLCAEIWGEGPDAANDDFEAAGDVEKA